MFENLSILLPYRPDQGIRDRNFLWVVSYYERMFPEAELCVGLAEDKPFNRSKAVNLAAAQATRSVFAIADADLFFERKLMDDSLQLLGSVPWIVPYRHIVRLSQPLSERILRSNPGWPLDKKLKLPRLKEASVRVGGLIVLERSSFESVGGFDERFIGWGGEDDAFASAANTALGRYVRLKHTIYHLWHPKVGYERNPYADWNLCLRKMYRLAEGDRKKLTMLQGGSRLSSAVGRV